MAKGSVLNVSKNIVIGVITIFFLWPLQSMDNPTIINDTMIAWSIVLTHAVNLFNYKAIASLIVSKRHDQLLQSTAQQRKNYFISTMPCLLSIKDIVWNEYGSACVNLVFSQTPTYSPLWDGWRGYIPYRDKEVSIKSRVLLKKSLINHASWDSFYDCLPHKPSAFFNQWGGVSFHGYGNMLFYGDEQSGNVIEYTTLLSGKKSTSTCVTRIEGKEIPLTMFLEFPILLKAFLNSSVTSEWSSRSVFHDKIKVYAIEGVTIPEHYKKHEQYFPCVGYKGFKALPKDIRRAIVARYKDQSKAQIKQKKKGIGCFG